MTDFMGPLIGNLNWMQRLARAAWTWPRTARPRCRRNCSGICWMRAPGASQLLERPIVLGHAHGTAGDGRSCYKLAASTLLISRAP